MTNYIFYQTSGLDYRLIEKEFEALSKVENVTLVPYGITRNNGKQFITGVSDFTLNKGDQVYMRGSTQIPLKNFEVKNNPTLTQKLKDSISYEPSFFSYQSQMLNLSTNALTLLNNPYELQCTQRILNKRYAVDLFMKPSNDLKAYSGVIVPAGKTLNEVLDHKYTTEYFKDVLSIISEVRDIKAEYRIFVVNNKIVTGSLYRKDGKPSVKLLDLEEPLFLNLLTTLLQYSCNSFVIDLCIVNEDVIPVKIMEYNCINCSGFYDSDVNLLFKHIFHTK